MARSRKTYDDDDDTPPKVKSDAYTGLLILAALGQLAAGIFLYLDWSQYPDKNPPKVMDRPAAVQAPQK